MIGRAHAALFTQTDVDSAALTMHVAVVHQFRAPGRYAGSVLRGDQVVASFFIDVIAESRDRQASVDLAEGARPAAGHAPRLLLASESEAQYRVSPEGYVVFHVGSGPGGLAVRVGPAQEKLDAPTFDSRELTAGDFVTVTLLRPGTYGATFGHGEAKIRVAYSDRKQRLGQMPPVEFEASEQGLRPEGAELQPTQGQTYRLNGPGRLQINLVEPDDGPAAREARGPVFRRQLKPEQK
jgi:hypothetical protein